MDYTPQPGTIPARVIEILSAHPGRQFSTAELGELLGNAVPSLTTIMAAAIEHGAVVRSQHPEDLRLVMWSLGSGVPVPRQRDSEDDEPEAPAEKPRKPRKPRCQVAIKPETSTGVDAPPATASAQIMAGFYAAKHRVIETFKQTMAKPAEADPAGLDQHAPGAKLDAGKIRPALVLGGFARALIEVTKVGTGGAAKYTEHGWTQVPNGQASYDDAQLRHWLAEHAGQPADPDTELLHAAHAAWNTLARLDLMLRERETSTPT